MKIVFIGCVEFSYKLLQHLITSVKDAEIVGVITRDKSAFNADFCSLKGIADSASIPCFLAEGNAQDTLVDWMEQLRPDVAYCFGWSYLLKHEVLNIPRLGVIGYHPAELPQNRGRHPIVWALTLGLPFTASTFFFMDEGADSGDILSQELLEIDIRDDAKTLYGKLEQVAVKQVSNFTEALANNSYKRISQDHAKANYWRKRSKLDGEIDWRMSAITIYNLVRALAKPYLGAHCIYKNNDIKIWRTELVDCDYKNIEPGKIIRVDGKDIWVKCGEGILKLISHEFTDIPDEGSYL